MRRRPIFFGSAKPACLIRLRTRPSELSFIRSLEWSKWARKPCAPSSGPSKSKHVKLAAGFEDAPHRTQCLPFFVRLEMVEHERRENAIEPRLGIRKLVSKSLIELDGTRYSRGVASGAAESLGIGVEANHSDLRETLPGQ